MMGRVHMVPKLGWQLAAGQEFAHWFKRHGFWYRSLCNSVQMMTLADQGHLKMPHKCSVCRALVEEREANGLPLG